MDAGGGKGETGSCNVHNFWIEIELFSSLAKLLSCSEVQWSCTLYDFACFFFLYPFVYRTDYLAIPSENKENPPSPAVTE